MRIERSVFFSRAAMDSMVRLEISHQFVLPAIGVAKRVNEKRARLSPHRSHGSGSSAFSLNDLAASIGRWRRRGNDQDPIRRVFGHPFGKLNL